MERKGVRSTYLAQAVSRFTNPSILSPVTLFLIAYTKSSSVRELIGWGAIILLFFVLIPIVYVYVRTSTSENHVKLVVELTLFLKQHPKDILILALSLGLSSLIILSFLKAPTILIASITALLSGAVVTAIFNIFYRASFHLTAITILIIVATQVWGQIFLILLAAIPLIAWAKFRIHDHTIPQLLMGIAVAVITSFATFYLFGLP